MSERSNPGDVSTTAGEAKPLRPNRHLCDEPRPDGSATAAVSKTSWSEDDPIVPPAAFLRNSWLECGRAVLDPTGHILQIDEALSHWFDREKAGLAGDSFWDLLGGRCHLSAEHLEILASGSSSFRELTLKPKAGAESSEPPPVQLEATYHSSGIVIRLCSTLPSLHEREENVPPYPCAEIIQRRLFARLARAEAQLKMLSDQWPGVIFSQRADFSFRFISPRIEELTGVPATEWQCRPHLFWQAVHEGDVDQLKQQIAAAKTSREPRTATYRLRHLKSGRTLYVLEHRRAHVSPGGLVLGYEGVWLDVTRQTLAERRLCTAAWKETLSVLTMGLAHDFGNVMAGIHALAESFLDQVGPQHEFVDGLSLMKQNSRQASQLVHRIIDLHENQPGECYYHNLNEIVVDLGDLIQKVIPRRVQLTIRPAPHPLPVYIDAVELRQVVLNLVLNAVDAMGPDGHLVLETHAWRELPPLGVHAGTPPRQPVVGLSVRDNGAGIAADHLPRVFEPFFTTKPTSKGSGLGLYNARMFADRHRGAVSVQSAPQRGAIVSLLLPEADFAEEQAAIAGRRSSGDPLCATSSNAAPPNGRQP